MIFNKILIISQDLIVANHLSLILSQENHNDFIIIQDVNSSNELIKYGGYHSIFLFDYYKMTSENLKIFSESKAIIYFITDKYYQSADIDRFVQKKNVEIIKMPFTRLEVKKALASVR
jgi:hypothetical protein